MGRETRYRQCHVSRPVYGVVHCACAQIVFIVSIDSVQGRVNGSRNKIQAMSCLTARFVMCITHEQTQDIVLFIQKLFSSLTDRETRDSWIANAIQCHQTQKALYTWSKSYKSPNEIPKTFHETIQFNTSHTKLGAKTSVKTIMHVSDKKWLKKQPKVLKKHNDLMSRDASLLH